MKILVTGCEGGLGRELRKQLATGGCQLGLIPGDFVHAEINYTDIQELDITCLAYVQEYIAKLKPSIIINCAAYTNVDACESQRDKAFSVNVLGVRNLAIAAESVGAKLVHISTDYVFDGKKTRPIGEYDQPNPLNVYGLSKALGEQYVQNFCSRWFIIRTSWLYGNYGKNFVNTIMEIGLKQDTLKVVSDQYGCPTNAEDLAYHIFKIADTKEYGIYHCTGNGQCTWFEFACKIIENGGIDAKVIPCHTNDYINIAKRPKYAVLDHMMLRHTVGDEMRKWKQALKGFLT